MGETHDPRALRNRLAMQGGRNIVLAPHAYGGEGSETSPRTAAGKLAVAAGEREIEKAPLHGSIKDSLMTWLLPP